MNVQQKLSILFFRKTKKANKKGEIPIYVRVTIDGLQEEFSSGIKVLHNQWDGENKTIKNASPNYKDLNKKIRQIQTDLERHFDLIQAKEGIATPQALIKAYQTPVNGQDLRNQKKENLEISIELDKLMVCYVDWCKQVKKTKERGADSPEKMEYFEFQKKQIKEQVKLFVKKAQKIFSDKDRLKTLMLAIDEYLLDFLQLALSGERSENTLEKWIGRKKRYQSFLNWKFKAADITLAQLEYSFLNDLIRYIMMHYNCVQNTAMKYAQCIKEVMDRAVSNKWVTANIFSRFQCSYNETQINWLELQQLDYFSTFEFSREKYNVIRDIYVATSFLGFAYADIYAASPDDVSIRMDGEKWVTKNRQKTGQEESVPILPIVERLLEKYKNHPVCLRKNRLLPVPSNQQYNKCLKEMGKEIGFKLLTEKGKGTHRVRYFFANVVTHNNGVPLKTIGAMLGQKSIRTTEKYVRPNKQQISENMQMVKEKLFAPGGNLITNKYKQPQTDSTADQTLKVVHIKRG